MFKKIEVFGQHAILISWGNNINKSTSIDIHQFNQKIINSHNKLISETLVTYCSLTVYLKDTFHIKHTINWLKKLYLATKNTILPQSKIWKIPVCYDPKFGIDLQTVASVNNISIDDVIFLHTQATYRVNFIGFLPGFPYLSGLNPRLYTPRRSKPRAQIARGSVAIGGQQTGVYPIKSPAGWQIIGRTPAVFFDSQKNPPCSMLPFDKLQFIAINIDQYRQLTDD